MIEKIHDLQKSAIIAVSGFGGSGKSTYAQKLGANKSAPVIGVDSFFKNRDEENYSDWDIIDFDRLKREVLEPFSKGKDIEYGHFDWNKNAVDKTIKIKNDGYLIVEGVGLFRPELVKYFAYKVWVDCPIEEAIARGKKRDRDEYHNPNDALWDGVWKRNDMEYTESFRPKEIADIIVNNADIANPSSES